MRATLLRVLPVLTCGLILLGADRPPGPTATLVVLPVQNRAGDQEAVAAVEQALFEQLGERAILVDRERTRDVLRRLRIRDGDLATPAMLSELADELKADWLISATVHDAERRDVPRLTLSARVYHGASGDLSWAGFAGGSGLDRRSVLGLGVVPDVESLASRIVGKLELQFAAEPRRRRKSRALGRLAIVPFGGVTRQRATANGETATEAARAASHQLGISLASPGCAAESMRRQRFSRRGGVDNATREALTATCGADSILTGNVERYEVGGGELEPEPEVALSLRLVDAHTGKVLWTDALERRGWQHQGLFRLGRVHSRGALADAMMSKLTRRLLRDSARREKREARKR